MRTRRLLALVALVVAPALAACGTMPTAAEDYTPPPSPTDTTKRKDNMPWN